jgi:pilus assembly protein CpaC
VRTKAGIMIVCCSAWLLFMCAGSTLQAQTQTPRPPYAPPTPGVSGQDAANELFVPVDKSVLVDVARPIQRIAVGLGELAEATAVSPNEILVNGKAPGETSLIVWETGGGRQFFNVIVRPSAAAANDRMEAVRRQLKTELPEQQVKASSENGLIFLRGTVKDLTSSERAVQIASTAGKVVNLLYVNVPSADPQILLKVKFASVDRNLTRSLGLNLFSTGAANTIGTVGTGQFPIPAVTDNPSTGPVATVSNALNLFFFRPDLNLGATIEALQVQGLVQVLAEPNVLAANGKQASFLAGGEYPFPVVQGVSGTIGGAVTIMFKEFGVRLNFIPTITPRGTIRLQVAPEVSSLDFTNAITLSGFSVPSIDIRRVKTEVELNEGQSFAIGGLLDNRETRTFQKIPFIGDIPILGKFFQSISTNKTNTELMVIVTPEIVAPMPAGQPLPSLKYPDKFLPSNSNMPMTTPGREVTGANAPAPPPPTMPVEKLIQSMQPEQQLVTETGYTGYIVGGYGSSQSGATTGTSTAPAAP